MLLDLETVCNSSISQTIYDEIFSAVEVHNSFLRDDPTSKDIKEAKVYFINRMLMLKRQDPINGEIYDLAIENYNKARV